MYDYVLKNGWIVDGSRKEPYRADLCIRDGLIAEIAPNAGEGRETIDISGLIVSPGFIDIHAHSDASPLVGYPVESKLAQGVTTEICGNCGVSLLPSEPGCEAAVQEYFSSELEMPLNGKQITMPSMTAYVRAVRNSGTALNVGMLVGHGTLRLSVMGFVDRPPTTQELEQMKSLLDRELSAGAMGMSLGLIYPPSAYGTTDELVELAKVVKKHNAILAVHMRSESVHIFEAVDEMLSVAEKSGVHLEISHLKLIGKPQWGRGGELLQKIRDARTRGIHVTCDQYPYTASSTALTALMPNWSHAGGNEEMLRRLREREGTLCEEMAQEMENRGGPGAILITSTHGRHPDYEGKTIDELAKELSLTPLDAVIQILLECEVSVACVFFCISEEDMLAIMAEPFICVGSDGYSFSYDKQYTKTNPHPRSFATFPQFFQTVREKQLMSIQDAVYKATALPAQILGLYDRGQLKKGMVADITIFDRERIASRSTYLDSKVRPVGISYVFVGGKLAYCNDRTINFHSGKVLLHL